VLDRELGMQRQGQKRASPGPALLSDIQARLGVFLCGGTAPPSPWLLSAEFSLPDGGA
jgi:hypothetical protein